MKTFELPVSDSGHFVAGELTEQALSTYRELDDPPKYGVIVWYRDKELAKKALQAAMDAHWTETAIATGKGSK